MEATAEAPVAPLPTPTAEGPQGKTPEKNTVTTNTQAKEIGSVASATIYTRAERIAKDLEKKTPAERASFLNSANKGIQTLRGIATLIEEGEKTAEDSKLITLPEPLVLNRNGKESLVRSVKGNGAGGFVCEVETKTTADSKITSQEVMSQQDLINAVIILEAPSITLRFSGAERQIVESYIGILANGEDYLKTQDAEVVNKSILEAAASAGAITIEDIKMFIEKTFPATTTTEDGKTLEVENPQAAKLKEILTGKNLVDPETITQVLSGVDFNAESQKISAKIQELEEMAKANPNDSGIAKSLEAYRLSKTLLENASTMLSDRSKLEAYFNKFETGKIDTSSAQQLRNSLRKGDMQTFVGILSHELRDDTNDTPEQKAEKEEKRKEVIQALEVAGAGSILLLVLMAMLAESFSKSVNS